MEGPQRVGGVTGADRRWASSEVIPFPVAGKKSSRLAHDYGLVRVQVHIPRPIRRG